MQWLNSNILVGCDFSGTCGRWVFNTIWLIVLSLALGVPQKLKAKWSAPETDNRFKQIADILYPSPPWYQRAWWALTFQTDASRADQAFDKRQAEFISLREAATRLYSHAVSNQLRLAKMVEPLREPGITPSTSDAILNFMALNISIVIQIYGKRPPALAHLEIPKDEIKAMVFKAGGAELHRLSDQLARYIDLEIRLSDLNKHIDGLARGMEIPFQ